MIPAVHSDNDGRICLALFGSNENRTLFLLTEEKDSFLFDTKKQSKCKARNCLYEGRLSFRKGQAHLGK